MIVRGARRGLRFSGGFLVLLLASACGGSTAGEDTRAGGAGAGTGAGGASPGSDGAIESGGAGGSAADAAAGSGGSTYVDPGCPPVSRPEVTYECDPDSLLGCEPGYKCSPFVDYADQCGTEISGTACVPEGTGVQGSDCTTELCAAGYVCASGGTGLECVKLCKPGSSTDRCPPGLVCVALDVDGFYVCG